VTNWLLTDQKSTFSSRYLSYNSCHSFCHKISTIYGGQSNLILPSKILQEKSWNCD